MTQLTTSKSAEFISPDYLNDDDSRSSRALVGGLFPHQCVVVLPGSTQ